MQTHYGSGPNIGGNLNGDVYYETLDAETKGTLDKLSKGAPALAKLLEKALRDGVISPDIVMALENVVRNINWDIAETLAVAGKNINRDVADSLLDAAQAIKKNTDDLNSALSSLQSTIEQAQDLPSNIDARYPASPKSDVAGASERYDRMIVQARPRFTDSWKIRMRIFCYNAKVALIYGAVPGFVIGFVLAYHIIKR